MAVTMMARVLGTDQFDCGRGAMQQVQQPLDTGNDDNWWRGKVRCVLLLGALLLSFTFVPFMRPVVSLRVIMFSAQLIAYL